MPNIFCDFPDSCFQIVVVQNIFGIKDEYFLTIKLGRKPYISGDAGEVLSMLIDHTEFKYQSVQQLACIIEYQHRLPDVSSRHILSRFGKLFARETPI